MSSSFGQIDWDALARATAVLDTNFRLDVVHGIRPVPAHSQDSRIRRRKLGVRREEDPDVLLAWTVAERIRAARSHLGWHQGKLAEQTGIARPNIVRLEAGRHLPTLSTLRRVASALGVTLAELVALPLSESEPDDVMLAAADLKGWEATLEDEDRE